MYTAEVPLLLLCATIGAHAQIHYISVFSTAETLMILATLNLDAIAANMTIF